MTELKFPPPIVIKIGTIVNKSAGVILILFTAATNLSSLRKSAGKKVIHLFWKRACEVVS